MNWTFVGDVILALGLAASGWFWALAFRDEMRDMKKTVYGSKEPPVEGLVPTVERHEEAIGRFAFLDDPRHR